MKAVHINRLEIAKMSYGLVPLIIRLMEGVEEKPPLHANVILPTKAVQIIRTFYERGNADEIMSKARPEDWVEYIDEDGRYHRFGPNEYGLTMVLPLN